MRYGIPHFKTTSGDIFHPQLIENIMLKHPAVEEAGVIFIMDAAQGRFVKAFISLREGYSCSSHLFDELKSLSEKYLPLEVIPEEIEVKDKLPRTKSGKILREMLKNLELSSSQEVVMAGIH